jgi:hypothetical protein
LCPVRIGEAVCKRRRRLSRGLRSIPFEKAPDKKT